MRGHIQLGATAATLRPYLLNDPRNYRAMTANPMAARVSTGSQYGDLQAWSTFLMADWQAGVGKTQAEAGGFLFAEAETRVPQQVILPAALGCAPMKFASLVVGAGFGDETPAYMPAEATAYTVQAVGGTGNPTRISIEITIFGTISEAPAERPEIEGVAVYGYIATGVEVTAALYSDSAGQPGSSLRTGTLTPTAAQNYRPGYQWYYIPLSTTYNADINGDVTCHWVIYPTSNGNEITLVEGDSYGDNSFTYDGSTWNANTGQCPFFCWSKPFAGYPGADMYDLTGARGFFIDGDSIGTVGYLRQGSTGNLTATPRALTYNASSNQWEPVTVTGMSSTWSGLAPDEVGPPVLFDGVVYIPQGANYSTWTLSSDTGGNSTNDAHFFCSWAGYLWRAYNNQLWYSTDGTTWTAITNDVGPSDYRIRGMAGFGQYLYVATDEALYYVAPGDVAVGLFPWSTIDEGNGVGMVVHQGALYIPVAGRILRYSEDGSLQDVWVSRDNDLNNRRLGKIAALAGLSSWLVAGVNGTTSSDPASVWAFTQQGWHHLATLPPDFGIRSMYYDRVRSRLWVSSDEWAIFSIYAPDWAINPYNDSSASFMPHGWLETGRIYSGLRELQKDWESVRLFGEFTPGDTDVVVYYRDAETEEWTSLGTATADAEELRWSDYATRPNGSWLKLGLLLRTDTPASTPKIEAVATKLLPMVTDRRAWNLAIIIHDDQEMVDGAVNVYTADEMIAHLRGLVEQVPPFIFEDVTGTQYEVKATGSAENILQYEWLDASQEVRLMWAFEVAVEQVTPGAYN
jgi:hypothetical protein